MKRIIVGVDGYGKVYLVPDTVEKKLKMYCNRFLDWMMKSEYDRFFDGRGLCYDEEDFINYLKEQLGFEKIYLIDDLGFIGNNRSDFPEKYRDCSFFIF